MSPLTFAWRSLTRQPARAVLAVAGVAVVGALLFDMLLLSSGLAVSFRELLEGVGFDVRVTASQWVPSRGPAIGRAAEVAARLRALAEIDGVAGVRFGRADVLPSDGESFVTDFMGVEGDARRTWTVLEGHDLSRGEDPPPPEILVNRQLARSLQLSPGESLRLRGACDDEASALPPADLLVVGIVDFQFGVAGQPATVTSLGQLRRLCGLENEDAMTLFLVASAAETDPDAVVEAIREALPELHAFTNRQFVDRLQVTDFSYFRQVSFALSAITLFFSFLLIATILTVSVNQRLGEVAALRALGFRRSRIVADLLCESTLLVGTGGLLALPLGGLLALRLDAILRQMPGIPVNLHFFVFQSDALIRYGLLLTAAGLAAAAYPVLLAARLPISATLRREVIS